MSLRTFASLFPSNYTKTALLSPGNFQEVNWKQENEMSLLKSREIVLDFHRLLRLCAHIKINLNGLQVWLNRRVILEFNSTSKTALM